MHQKGLLDKKNGHFALRVYAFCVIRYYLYLGDKQRAHKKRKGWYDYGKIASS